MKLIIKGILFFFLSILILFYSLYYKLDNGITDKKIILGQSSAITGAASDLGKSFRDGALAYFAHINLECPL